MLSVDAALTVSGFILRLGSPMICMPRGHLMGTGHHAHTEDLMDETSLESMQKRLDPLERETRQWKQ